MCICRACCVFMNVCFVLILFCFYICICVCLQIQGPLRECRLIRSGVCGPPYSSYVAPLVCIPAVIGGLAVWRHTNQKPKKKLEWVDAGSFGSIWWNSLWFKDTYSCVKLHNNVEFFFGVHCVSSCQVHMFNFTTADIYRFWSIFGILGPFASSVFLFCHPFGDVIA